MLDPERTRELVKAAAGGDRDAWERLVDEYSGLVWSVIRGCGLYGPEGADGRHRASDGAGRGHTSTWGSPVRASFTFSAGYSKSSSFPVM